MRLILCILFINLYSFAQEYDSDVIENAVLNSDAEFENEMLVEDLKSLAINPININDTLSNFELFYQYGLLTPVQSRQIREYVKQYGSMLTKAELIAVPTLSSQDVNRISPYVTLVEEEESLSLIQQIKSGRGLLVLRNQQVLEEQRGFQSIDGEPPRYEGSQQRLYLKFRQQYRDNLSIGFLADKDAGESFFSNSNSSGFDFYSAHIAFQPNSKLVNQVVVGDYEIKSGQGLVQWNGFALGKGASATDVFLKSPLIRPYTSSNERNFLRGATAEIQLSPRFTLSPYFSIKNIDANQAVDSIDNSGLTSIQISGLHRTENEIADEKSIRELLGGMNLTYENSWLKVGVTAQQARLSDSLIFRGQDFQRFFPQGDQFTNAGVHYTAVRNRFYFFGETAVNQDLSIATLHGVQHFFKSGVKGTIVYRNYDRGYQSFYANALSEATNVGNERGVYLGFNYSPAKSVTFDLFYDRFSFPWQRFRVSRPSRGSEVFFRTIYEPNEQMEIELRSQFEQREINISGNTAPTNELSNRNRSANRIELRYRPDEQFYLKSRIGHASFKTSQKDEHGFLVFQDVIYSFPQKPIKLYSRFALFNTPSFDSRVFAYENDLLYNFNVPPYFGEGIRYYAMVSAEPLPRIKVWLRGSQTIFSDRDQISSGNDLIEGNTRSDIRMQIQWQF